MKKFIFAALCAFCMFSTTYAQTVSISSSVLQTGQICTGSAGDTLFALNIINTGTTAVQLQNLYFHNQLQLSNNFEIKSVYRGYFSSVTFSTLQPGNWITWAGAQLNPGDTATLLGMFDALGNNGDTISVTVDSISINDLQTASTSFVGINNYSERTLQNCTLPGIVSCTSAVFQNGLLTVKGTWFGQQPDSLVVHVDNVNGYTQATLYPNYFSTDSFEASYLFQTPGTLLENNGQYSIRPLTKWGNNLYYGGAIAFSAPNYQIYQIAQPQPGVTNVHLSFGVRAERGNQTVYAEANVWPQYGGGRNVYKDSIVGTYGAIWNIPSDTGYVFTFDLTGLDPQTAYQQSFDMPINGVWVSLWNTWQGTNQFTTVDCGQADQVVVSLDTATGTAEVSVIVPAWIAHSDFITQGEIREHATGALVQTFAAQTLTSWNTQNNGNTLDTLTNGWNIPLQSCTTYDITFTTFNPCGGSLTGTETISTRGCQAVTVSAITASQDTICRGSNTQLTWSTQNAVSGHWYGPISSPYTIGGGTVTTDPLYNTTTFTFIAFGAGGDTMVQTVTVNVINCTTGINETEAAANISVFPNPATNLLNIDNLPNDTKEFEIVSVTGAIIAKQETSTQHTTINVSNLTPGFYFVKFNIGNSEIVKKFVKE